MSYTGCLLQHNVSLSHIDHTHTYTLHTPGLHVFGILMVVFTLLVVTCAEMSVLLVYLQLCAEDYNWWWRSFVTSGSVSIFVFIQSIHYFSLLEANTLSTYLLYFGYNGIICVGFFMMTGSIGLFSCLTFNRAIYSAIKVD